MARLASTALVALAAAFVFLPTSDAQVVTLDQSFTGTTAPGWVLGGSGYTPVLTAAQGIDPSGSGWLRLTSNAQNESTYAYDSTSFASANATITATFNLAMYNGSSPSADGITFFLADAAVVAADGFSPGAYGGSLGYAQKTGINGLSGGYLGIGIDQYGNYSNPTEGRVGGTGFVPNAIAVRGPGSGTSGYDYLGGSSSLPQTLSYPGQTTRPSGSEAETVQMVLTSTNQLTVSIEFGNSGVFVTEFTANLSGYTRPNNLIMGFTAGTGTYDSIQEIQGLTLTSITANLWTNANGDSSWNTANDWYGVPTGAVPLAGADVLLNNAYVNSAQTISVGSNQVLRSLQIDAPFSYTLSGGSIEFNTEGNGGNSGIIVTQSNGNAVQTVNSALKADNGIIVENNTNSALNLTGTLNLQSYTANFNGSGAVNESGIISGTGSIYQTGTGTTTLSGANTYSGGTSISAGTLDANANTALGTGTVSLTGGTLGSTNSSTISNAITLGGSAALSGITSSGTLTQSGGSYTLDMANATQSGSVKLASSNTAQTLTVEVDSGTSTISGAISNYGTTADGLTKTGSGTLVLSNASNAYTGTTTINAGTVQLGANNAIPSSSSIVLGGGNLALNKFSDAVASLTINAPSTIDLGSGGTNAFVFTSFTDSTNSILTIANYSGSNFIATTTAGLSSTLLNDIYFSGYGSGTVEAGSKTTHDGVSSYLITPATTFTTWDGAESATSSNWGYKPASISNWSGNGVPSTLATSTQKLDFTGTVGLAPTMDGNYSANAIKFDTAAGAFDITQAGYTLTLYGTLPSIIQQSSANQIISGGTVLLGANSVIDVSGAGSLTISSNLSTGSNSYSLTKLSAGTLALSGSNGAFTGPITVEAGTLQVSTNNNVLGTGTTTIDSGAALQITDGRTLTVPLSITGTGISGAGAIDSEAGSGNTATLSGAITLGGNTTIGSGTGTLDLGGSITGSGDNLTLTGAGNMAISSAIATGSGSVTVNSTGTTTFSGANTYTGATTVNSGTLDLNGTASGGIVLGSLTLNGGTVNDMASGQLNTSSPIALTINSGTFNLGGATESISNFNGVPGGVLALGTGYLTENGSGAMSFGGTFTGSGTFDQENTGKLILSGTSSAFTGNIVLNNGVIQATANDATGTTGSTVTVGETGNFELQGGVSLASNFALSTTGASTGNGAIENVTGNNTITGNLSLSAASRIQSDAGTLTVSGTVAAGANTLNVGGNSNTTLNGAITGTSASALTKDGTGTLAIGASNSGFAGSVTVSAGTLQTNVANAFTSSTAITVNTGAIMSLNSTSQVIGTLSDAGSLTFGTGGSLTLSSGASSLSGTMSGSGTLILNSGSTLTLGANFSDSGLNIVLNGGTLKLNGTNDTFGSLTVGANSIVDFASPSASELSVTSVTLSGSSVLTVDNWTNGVDYFYSGVSPGAEGTAPENQIAFTGYSPNVTHWNTDTTGPDAGNEITPAPEASTYGVLFVGLSLVGIVVYRRKRNAP